MIFVSTFKYHNRAACDYRKKYIAFIFIEVGILLGSFRPLSKNSRSLVIARYVYLHVYAMIIYLFHKQIFSKLRKFVCGTFRADSYVSANGETLKQNKGSNDRSDCVLCKRYPADDNQSTINIQ